MSKRLLLDLNRCDQCDRCGVRCAYFYRAHPRDHGVFALRERATYALVCRRCEEPSCVNACPYDALQRRCDGSLVRHNLRCVSCGLCAQACPFGTIYPDMLGFYLTPCDYCLGSNARPACAGTCERGAIDYVEVSGDELDVHVLDEHLAVRAPRWVKSETQA